MDKSGAGDFAPEAEVVDLLVLMAKVGVKAVRRRDLIFDPFPQICDPDNREVAVLSPHSQDWALLERLIRSIPSMQQLMRQASAKDFGSIKATMEAEHGKYAFPMLQWIISSSRCRIVHLNSGARVKSMSTPFQYLLSDLPEKEEAFRQHKKMYGTTFAFHGSPFENWHGILRKGLINASDTKWMANGRAHGAGIYLSPAASTCVSYCGTSQNHVNAKDLDGWMDRWKTNHDSTLNFPMICIAVCEVIDKDISKHDDIWVQPQKDLVSARCLFLFPDGFSGEAKQCRTDNSSFKKELLHALAYPK